MADFSDWKSLVENIPVNIIVVDRDQNIRYVNKVPKGLSEGDIVGRNVLDIIEADDDEMTRERIERVFRTGESDYFESRSIGPMGKPSWQENHLSPVYDGEQVTAVSLTSRDIMERKYLEGLIKAQRDLALGLSRSGSFEASLTLIVDNAIAMAGLDSGGIYLFEEDGSMKLAYSKGLGKKFTEKVQSYDKGSPNMDMVLEGEPIYASYEEIELPKDDIRMLEGLKALAILPVKKDGRVIACLNLASHIHERIPLYSRDVLETIGNWIGMALKEQNGSD